jgi:hypothetical protein
MKIRLFWLLIFISLIAFTTTALAQSEWLIEKNPPNPIGPEVTSGRTNDPGPVWPAPANGLLQQVFWNVDPHCNETGVVSYIDRTDGTTEQYIVPSATSCKDPSGDWYISRIFNMQTGDKARVEFGQDSTQYWAYFATHTPTPESEATNTPTATPTNTATTTPTATATATHTPSPTPTSTATATATFTPQPPEQAGVCIRLSAVPPLPEAIEEAGFLTNFLVETAGTVEGYTLIDGEDISYFTSQPIENITVYPNHTYKVVVSKEDKGCVLGPKPTGLGEGPQPVRPVIYLPSIEN